MKFISCVNKDVYTWSTLKNKFHISAHPCVILDINVNNYYESNQILVQLIFTKKQNLLNEL